jgi:hypothetical protein
MSLPVQARAGGSGGGKPVAGQDAAAALGGAARLEALDRGAPGPAPAGPREDEAQPGLAGGAAVGSAAGGRADGGGRR